MDRFCRRTLALLLAALMLSASLGTALANAGASLSGSDGVPAWTASVGSDASLQPAEPAHEVPEPAPEVPEPAPEAPEPAPEVPVPAPEALEPAPETPEPAPEVSEPAPAPETPETEDAAPIQPDEALLAQTAGSSGMLFTQSVSVQSQTLSGLVPGRDYIDDELLFPASSREEAEEIAARYGGTLLGYAHGAGRLRLMQTNVDTLLYIQEQAASAPLSMMALSSDGVAVASQTLDTPLQPNYIYHSCVLETPVPAELADSDGEWTLLADGEQPSAAAIVPADPFFTNGTQAFHTAIGSLQAWEADVTGRSIKVAVIDSGIDPDHPDLQANIGAYTYCEDFAAGKTNGYITNGPEDNGGHGTHVAGIIAAVTNTLGGLGVAPEASIYSYKALDYELDSLGKYTSKSTGNTWAIREGVYWAMDNGVEVINMSLGGSGADPTLETAIAAANAAGILVVAAAGNNNSSALFYPAAFNGVLAVGALNTDNSTRAFFSNYGSWVDVAAPGVNIRSTYKNGTYNYLNGTSQASPIVAGVAALLYSIMPTRGVSTKETVEDILLGTTTPISAEKLGVGSVSAANAVQSAFSPSPSIIMQGRGSTFVSGSRAFVLYPGTFAGDKAYTLYYTLDGSDPSSSGTRKTYTGLFYPTGLGTTTLRAICLCDGAYGTEVSATFTLQQAVEHVTISGPSHLAAGKRLKLSAEVAPATAVNKALLWKAGLGFDSNEDPAIYLRVDQDGTVTTGEHMLVLRDVTPVIAYAIAKDRPLHRAASDGHVIYLYPEAVQKIVFHDGAPITAKTLSLHAPTWDASAHVRVYGNDLRNDSGAGTLYCDALTWSSTAPAVVSVVSSTGVVTAHKPGTATLRATAADGSGVSATCRLSVNIPAASVAVTRAGSYLSDVLIPGKTAQLTAAVYGAGTDIPTDRTVVWRAEARDEHDAWQPTRAISVSASGLVRVNEGMLPADGPLPVRVIAEAHDGSGCMDAYEFTLYPQSVTAIGLDAALTLYAGSAPHALMPRVNGLDHQQIQDENLFYGELTWKTGNPAVVAIVPHGSDNGCDLVPLAPGRATLTATAADGSGRTAVCTVTVKQPATDILLSRKDLPGSDVLLRGKTAAYAATLLGSPTDAAVSWRLFHCLPGETEIDLNNPVSREDATVSAAGVVSFPQGSALPNATRIHVAAQADRGRLTRSLPLTLYTNPVQRVSLDPAEPPPLYVHGAALPLTPRLYGADGQHAGTDFADSVSYKSSNRSVATVESDGVVTPLSAGTAVITCTAGDGSGQFAKAAVTVLNPASSVAIYRAGFAKDALGNDITATSLAQGKTAAFTAAVSANDGLATNRTVTYSLCADDGGAPDWDSPVSPDVADISPAGLVSCHTVSTKTVVYVVATANGADPADPAGPARSAHQLTLYPEAAGVLHMENAAEPDIPIRAYTRYRTATDGLNTLDLRVVHAVNGASALGDTCTDQFLWSLSNPALLTLTENGGPEEATLKTRGALGVCTVTATAMDGSGSKVSIPITVADAATGVTLSRTDLPDSHALAGGKTARFKAVPTGDGLAPTDKSIQWTLLNEAGNPLNDPNVAKLTQAGVLTANAALTAETNVLVRARAKGSPDAYADHPVTLYPGAAASVAISRGAGEALYVSRTDLPLTLQADVAGDGDFCEAVIWTSSDPRVATFHPENPNQPANGDTCTLIPGGMAGSAIITAKAADGSGKLATYTVKVNDLAVRANITRKDMPGSGALCADKTAVYIATVMGEKGKLADARIQWELYQADANGVLLLDGDAPREIPASVADIKGGVVTPVGLTDTVHALVAAIPLSMPEADREAYAKEAGNHAPLTLYPRPVSSIAITAGEVVSPATLFTATSPQTLTLTALAAPDGACCPDVSWSCSAPKVLEIHPDSPQPGQCELIALSQGTATVTATAMDGSGKKAAFIVKVGVPPTALTVTARDMLPDGYTVHAYAGQRVQLSALVRSDYGVPTDKGVTWRSDDPAVTVSNTGLVSLRDGVVPPNGGVSAAITARSGANGIEGSILLTYFPRSVGKVVMATPNQQTLYVGNTLPLSAYCANANGSSADAGSLFSSELLWRSSKETVAAVDADGVVTAVSAGTAVITAKAIDGSNRSAVCTVTVRKPAMGVTIERKDLPGAHALGPGKSAAFTATVTGENGSRPTLATVDWAVTNPDGSATALVAITPTGMLTAASYIPWETRLLVTATAKGGDPAKPAVRDAYPVTLHPRLAQGVTLHDNALTLYVGGTSGNLPGSAALNAAVAGSNCGVTWISGKPAVAGVQSDGTLTAVSAGTAVVTAKAADGSGKQAACTVTVLNPATDVTLTRTDIPDSHDLGAGKTARLKAALSNTLPGGKPPTRKTVRWSSDKPHVAMVSAAGVVTAARLLGSKQEVIITATAPDGGAYAVYPLTVYPQSAGSLTLAVDPASIHPSLITGTKAVTLYIASAFDSLTLLPTVRSAYGLDAGAGDLFGASLLWKSSNRAVADVDQHGVVRAGGKPGTAIITAKTTDGSNKSAAFTVTSKVPASAIALARKDVPGGHAVIAGKSAQLAATLNAGGLAPTLKTVQWRSSSPQVSVNAKGLVQLLPGVRLTQKLEVTITARALGIVPEDTTVTAEYDLTFYPTATLSLTLPGTLQLTLSADPAEDSTHALTATLHGSGDAGEDYCPDLSWTSSNRAVADVRSDGLITARGKGTAVITVRALDGSGKKAACRVSVTAQTARVLLSRKDGFDGAPAYIAGGRSVALRATPQDRYGSAPSNAKVNYRLLDETGSAYSGGYAALSAAGVLTVKPTAPRGHAFAVAAYSAEDPALQASLSFRVSRPITGWFFTRDADVRDRGYGEKDKKLSGLKLRAGEEDLVFFAMKPVDAGCGAWRVSSTRPAIATAELADAGEQQIRITARSPGATVIRLAAGDGSGNVLTLPVTVSAP